MAFKNNDVLVKAYCLRCIDSEQLPEIAPKAKGLPISRQRMIG